MTTINTSSLSAYSSVFTAALKNDESTKGDAATVNVNLRGSVYKDPQAKGTGRADEQPSSPSDQAIEQLQEQIKQTQKILQQQQAQLAVAQNSKAPEEEKAQQVMAVQQQIAGTMAQLNAQQAALLELMKGTVSTTA
ncbi:hypothetical protein [Pseudomonas sp. LP_7_YM]|uniref:hypothetical protein n=1 Tax=Pseudomonas sp. LP_7_YM TaxID=2485137 RepID=UPI00105E19B4|nr:hypothetical protein [Pseudomonas sp. LP_7_YM]TDV60873.1 hypothetical protein EC915_110119 [Pseudomonas sp. LP_7_YM]